MPPGGLYPIPRHHQYGMARLNRPVYNTNDFADEAHTAKPQPSEVPKVDSERDKTEGDASKTTNTKEGKKTKKHRDSNGRRERSSQGTAAAAILQELGADATPAYGVNPNIKAKRSKEKNVEKTGEGTPQTSAKKRKRESGSKGISPLKANPNHQGNGSFVIGPDMLKGIEAIMSGMGAIFDNDAQEPEKKKSKKKTKSDSKHGNAQMPTVPRAETAQSSQTSNAEKTHRKSSGATSHIPKTPKSEKQRKASEVVPPKESQSSVRSEASPVKHTPVPLPPPSQVKHTPVPLPPPSSLSSFSANRAASQRKVKKAINTPEIMVPETPPSKATTSTPHAFKSAIPFPSSRIAEAAKSTPRTARKERLTHELNSSNPSVNHDAPTSAPPSTKKADEILRECGILSQKSPSRSRKITAPLNDEPKPRPRGRASSQSSSSSRSSSISIPDLFNRMNNSTSRSRVDVDPFVIAKPQKKQPRETHDETAINVFEGRYLAAQNAVNFSNEQEYLNQYLDWQVNNASEYPFPCLGQLSGCNSNKERILRLSKDENVNILKALGITDGDNEVLKDAADRSVKAEEFLKMAIRARIPVPLGRLEGTWILYCPKYGERHFDRYGFGKRKFTMSPISGFKDKTQYTGLLDIPPRSGLFSIRMFAVPPHASFRSTIITTAEEGYQMDVIFLGNGYLHLKVDLNLLLRGKPTEMVGGKKVFMEFLGVHEKAVEWVEKKDEMD
ncbi:hypothetical protein K491DRAFT_735832 [Lophiostoma macrostomum CBS 122681]|uniref:Uncharacterized protein n=1 Tax=Lophiostoma macrostomum CBS 122681 TaxID=1314788 RepID=A0A6A6SPU0_9PLEO|nr:hypothetical protein K491DRAFT_735832 [Lophiostoma macrostomum CBS 122681]